MTAEPHPQEYVATNEDLECLCDYFYAALAHAESNAHLDRLWMQELGVIRSRPAHQQREQEIREKVLDKLQHLIDTMKEPDGSKGELIHVTGLKCIIDSLRSKQGERP